MKYVLTLSLGSCLLVSCAAPAPAQKAPSSYAVQEVQAPACAERAALTVQAMALAETANAAPDDESLDADVIAAGARLGLHQARHHENDSRGDFRGYLALAPAIVRAAQRGDCARAAVAARVQLIFFEAKPALAVIQGPARSCALTDDVAWLCTRGSGLSTSQREQARALVREVWVKAKTGAEQEALLKATVACTERDEDLSANLAFFPERTRADFLARRERARQEERRQFEREIERRSNVGACESQCIAIFGQSAMGGPVCGAACDRGAQACFALCNRR